MTPEQWQNVREVLAEALELKPEDRLKFLDRVCSSDSSLRREVERLLSSSDEARSNFLESSTLRVTLTPGTKLGDYEVLGLIGAGGMGEVYRARDMRLRRDVAIKVLPSSVLHDPERLRRFEQEARATATLNHPNILAIFHMGTYEGAPYLVSELLDGATLRDQLLRGPMPVRKAVDYSVQIAHGLAAAHAKGVVHRDLKPENLFITSEGRAKILDFGLAKLTQAHWVLDGSIATATEGTEPGVVMGTVGYMSPEQVSGKPADHRADIFSLGTIMYEAVTGKRAFQKPTAVETMNAILNEDPPTVSQCAPSIPLALQKVIHRCLDKLPEQRFQSASDLAFALEAASDSGVQPTAALTESKRPLRKRKWLYVLISAALVVAAALGLLEFRPRSSLIPTTDWVQVTNFTDSVTQPAFSRDGRMLTFLRGNNTFTTPGQVFVMLLPNGNPVRLTNDSLAKMSPIFSPDGTTIAYTVPWDTWTVPILGGEPQLWLPNASGLSWVDADHLMFSEIISGAHMQLVTSDLGRAHVQSIYIPEPVSGMAHRSYLSPDGKWVIAVEMTRDLWQPCRLVPFGSSSRGTAIGPAAGACTAAGWSKDGKWMYLNSNSGNAFHIWRQRFPNGRIQQITSGPTEEEGIAIAPDGKSLVTSVGINRSAVWLHDSHGERMLTSEATAALADSRNGSPFSRDGKKLYYVVRRSRGQEIWADQAVGELRELDLRSGASQTILPGFSISDFSLSPNGRDIAFSALDERGTLNIWIAALDRSSSPRLLQNSAQRARFTSDFIYYIKRGPAASYAYRIRPDGSGNEQIWHEGAIGTVGFSPDGLYFAATTWPPSNKHAQWRLVVVDWVRKRVQPVCDDAVAYWSDDGKTFFVIAGFGKRSANPLIYVIRLRERGGIPELPPKGLSDISQITRLTNAQVSSVGMIGPGPSPDTYAYVKETAQRNLYSIPLN